MQIAGLAAVVTGGASGLGAATARRLAQEGAKVTIIDQSPQAQTIAAEIGGLAIACDVRDPVAGGVAFDQAQEKFGPCALLVNCAGVAPAERILGREGPMPLDHFQRVIDINLIGSFNMMRLAAQQMAGRTPNADGERGVIINTASVAAYEGQIGQAAYAASKGAIVGLTLPAAREFAKQGIRVNAIAPGLFATPMLLAMPDPVQQSLQESLPFPSRFGKPEEYADLACHIISNAVINGTVIRLDSALRMQPR